MYLYVSALYVDVSVCIECIECMICIAHEIHAHTYNMDCPTPKSKCMYVHVFACIFVCICNIFGMYMYVYVCIVCMLCIFPD